MWPEVGQLTAYTDATTGATVLSLMNEGALDKLPTLVDMLLGKMGGSLGEVSALALLLGLVFILWKKIITWQIPVSILLTVKGSGNPGGGQTKDTFALFQCLFNCCFSFHIIPLFFVRISERVR